MKKRFCKSGLSLFLAFLLVLFPLSLSVRAVFGESDYAAVAASTADAYKSAYPGNLDSTFPWFILDLGRSDAEFSTTYLSSADTQTFYYDQLDFIKTGSSPGKIARAVLSLSSMGFDATALANGAGGTVNAVDVLLCLSDSALAGDVNSRCYILLALDCGDYSDIALGWGLTAVQTRDHLKETILDARDSAGGWAWDGGTGVDTNTTAAAIAALAPYYNENADVKAAVDGALAWLKTQYQAAGFGYSPAWNSPDACSTAQVILALLALGIDPCAYETGTIDPASGSETADLMEILMAFRDTSGRIGGDSDFFTNEQGLRAVLAYREYLHMAAGTPVLFYRFGSHVAFDATLSILADGTGSSGSPEVTGRTVSVRVEGKNSTLLPKTAVTVTNQNPSLSAYNLTDSSYLVPSGMHALISALASGGLSVSSPDFEAAGGYITAIGSIASGFSPNTYWSFYINNQSASLGAANYALTDGDSLVFYYTDCGDIWTPRNVYTYFTAESASILTGQSVTLTLMDESGSPVSGARLLVSAAGGSSAETPTEVTTDAGGRASLPFSAAGTYLISAQKLVDSVNTISRPFCRVVVSDPYIPSDISVTLSVAGVDGVILSSRTVIVSEGASAFDALNTALTSAGVDLQVKGSGSSVYVESIAGLAAFNYGDNSGWLYCVNGTSPSVGCGAYILSSGDRVEFRYTTDWYADSPVVDGGEEEIPIDTDAIPSPFPDETAISSWAREGVARAVSLGILRGDDIGALRPQDSVTRGELCAMLLRTLGWSVPEIYSFRFSDVNEQDWCWPWIQAAADTGIVTGTGGGLFRPDDPVTRQDMAVMLSRAFTIENGDGLTVFFDRDEASAYALDAIEALVSAELMRGNGVKFFPLTPATREMAAVVLSRCLDRG